MRVLLYVPLRPFDRLRAAPTQPRIEPETWASLQALQWPGTLDIVLGRNDTVTGHRYEDLANKHNQARTLALYGGYDALMFVEADMVIPADALERLAAVDADVVYGLYCSRHTPQFVWLCCDRLSATSVNWLVTSAETAGRIWGRTVESAGVGLGCTLIRRQALDSVGFRTHPKHTVADDWLFSLDCQRHGLRQAHDLGVVCGHIVDDKMMVWPSRERLIEMEMRHG